MLNRFEIWMARVAFEDSPEVKQRPVLIWNDVAFAIVAYKMTSVDRGDNKEEYRIRNWEKAGLTCPTSIRINKVLRLTPEDLIKKIGTLDEQDQARFSLRVLL